MTNNVKLDCKVFYDHHDSLHRVSSLSWIQNDFITLGDDLKLNKWAGSGTNATSLEVGWPNDSENTFPTMFSKSNSNSSGTLEGLLASTSSGKFFIFGKSGRIEKTIDAHESAVLCIKWSDDGSTIITGAEDGSIKVWSKSGMLRSTLVQPTGMPIVSMSWSADGQRVAYTHADYVSIKNVNLSTSNSKPFGFKAHEGAVLSLDWGSNGNILTGGEDNRYKVWDSLGRIIFSSSITDYPITSVAWSPTSKYFLVGSFDSISLCDENGWISNVFHLEEFGSVIAIQWKSEGRQVVFSGTKGTVGTGNLLGDVQIWKNLQAELVTENQIYVFDSKAHHEEKLELRDNINWFHLCYGYLIVITCNQIYIYLDNQWNTPSIITFQNPPVAISPAEKHLAIVDANQGVIVYNTEGKVISTSKIQIGASSKPWVVSINGDILGLRDRLDDKVISFFDIHTGKAIPEAQFTHKYSIENISLDPAGPPSTRQLAFLDQQKDLYLVSIYKQSLLRKLHSFALSFAWHENLNMLAVTDENQLIVYYYPNGIFVDHDIFPQMRHVQDITTMGKRLRIESFTGSQVVLKNDSGILISVGITPYILYIHDAVKKQMWEQCVRICRFVKSKELWATLAAMSFNYQELETAEVAIAYAAIDDIGKLQFMNYIKGLPSKEERFAEIAAFKRNYQEAEAILINTGEYEMAIKLAVRVHRWTRAFELSKKYKILEDEVLEERTSYLRRCGLQESINVFQSSTMINKSREASQSALNLNEELVD